MKRNFAVRPRSQAVTRQVELALNRFIAIKFAIDDDPGPSIFADDGLIPSRQVDDAKSRMAEGNPAVLRHPVALPVWSAVIEALSGLL
jgi:hypothetical protein